MKYQQPLLHPMNESFIAYAACGSGNQAKKPVGCLSGVIAVNSACSQGVHPARGCASGTLPGNDCASGGGDSEW